MKKSALNRPVSRSSRKLNKEPDVGTKSTGMTLPSGGTPRRGRYRGALEASADLASSRGAIGLGPISLGPITAGFRRRAVSRSKAKESWPTRPGQARES